MIDGRLINSPQEIIKMWLNHFKILGCFGQDISCDEKNIYFDERKLWVVVLLSHMKYHLLPRRIKLTVSQYLFLFHSYKDLNMAKSA